MLLKSYTQNPFGYRNDVESLSHANALLFNLLRLISKSYNLIFFYYFQFLNPKSLRPRYDDFVSFYSAEKKRKDIDITNYTISDALLGLQITRNNRVVIEPADALKLFQQQLNILTSLSNCFESSLFNIRELLQADIFESELDGARELHKNGFYRAAGALCGVILEKHFAGVCASHSIKMKKAAPGISDYNEKLKDEAVVDNKTYLLIQRLGTIRNLCDHNKKQEPTKDDIEDLINGTDKILHEVL